MITLLIFTNGRDELLAKTVESFCQNVNGPIKQVLAIDDTPGFYHNIIDILSPLTKYAGCEIVTSIRPNKPLGFGGAIRFAWQTCLSKSMERTPYYFHLEDDFLFNRSIDLWDMMGIMDTDPMLAQLALMRQPWGAETAPLYELYKGCFSPGKTIDTNWNHHELWFTTNPCLYKREIVQLGWPEGPESEGQHTAMLKELGYRFGYMGSTDDSPWVTHIGVNRVGHGY